MKSACDPSNQGRQLRLWQALALSLGLVAPTLAMSGNTQGLVSSVGKAMPMVFVLGFMAVALVAHGFVRLTGHYNHAGSAYGLVAAAVGQRLGFFAGFAFLGAHLFFSIETLAAVGAFTNPFSTQLLPKTKDVPLPWILPALIGASASA